MAGRNPNICLVCWENPLHSEMVTFYTLYSSETDTETFPFRLLCGPSESRYLISNRIDEAERHMAVQQPDQSATFSL